MSLKPGQGNRAPRAGGNAHVTLTDRAGQIVERVTEAELRSTIALAKLTIAALADFVDAAERLSKR